MKLLITIMIFVLLTIGIMSIKGNVLVADDYENLAANEGEPVSMYYELYTEEEKEEYHIENLGKKKVEIKPVERLKTSEMPQIIEKIKYIKANCKIDKRCQNGQLRFENPGNIKELVKELKQWTIRPNTIYQIK